MFLISGVSGSGAVVGEGDGERSNGQVVTFGLETVLIGNPGEGETVAFRGNPVRRSLVGVAHTGLVILAVSVASIGADVLLGLGFFAGSAVGTSVAEYITRSIILQFRANENVGDANFTSSGCCRPNCGHQIRW